MHPQFIAEIPIHKQTRIHEKIVYTTGIPSKQISGMCFDLLFGVFIPNLFSVADSAYPFDSSAV